MPRDVMQRKSGFEMRAVQVWLSIGFRSLLRRALLSVGIADDKQGFGCNDAGGAVACGVRPGS